MFSRSVSASPKKSEAREAALFMEETNKPQDGGSEEREEARQIPDFNRFVAIDIETTGLDPSEGEIIELGAVRFIDGEETGTFRTLVRPVKGFPERNRRLTGIDPKSLETAPTAADALIDFIEFIGDDLLVSHNAPFDINFLSHHLKRLGREEIGNPAFCTLHFSAFINPEAPTLQLTALATNWDVKIIDPHRALQDARMAGRLALKMMEELGSWSRVFIAHLTSYRGKSIDPIFDLFDKLADTETEISDWDLGKAIKDGLTSGTYGPDLPELRSIVTESPEPKDDREVVEAVTEAFARGGKTLLEDSRAGSELLSGHLMPAEVGVDRLVVGITGDSALPMLITKGKSTDGSEVFYLGRRGEYITLERAFEVDGKPTGWLELSPYERVVLVRWLAGTRTGRVSRVNWWLLNNYSGLKGYLNALSATEPECSGTGEKYTGPCFAEAACERAGKALKIIVDHRHLCTRGAEGFKSERLLESKGACIIENGSQLVHAARASEGRILEIDALLRRLRTTSKTAEGEFAEFVKQAISQLLDLIEACRNTIRSYRDLYPQAGTSPIPIDEESWNHEIFMELGKSLKSTGELLADLAVKIRTGGGTGGGESITGAVLDCAADTLIMFGSTPKEWALALEGVPARNPKRVTLRMTPVEIGDVITRLVEGFDKGIVFTDRRLTSSGSFDRIRTVLEIGSDSPIEERVLEDESIVMPPLFLPEDVHPPTSRSGRRYHWQKYMDRTANLLRMVAETLGGRTVAAFSAHHELRKVREILEESPPKDCIVLAQYMDGTKSSLVREYLTNPATLLLGGRTFLDGVDLRPAGFTALVLVKLPFVSPEEPIHRAALRSLESQGVDGMSAYLIPLAVERSNRWIDSLVMGPIPEGQDPDAYPGAVILLDPRPTQNEWGEEFISSLVTSPVHRLPFREMLVQLGEMVR